jgi:hypothetical protein
MPLAKALMPASPKRLPRKQRDWVMCWFGVVGDDVDSADCDHHHYHHRHDHNHHHHHHLHHHYHHITHAITLHLLFFAPKFFSSSAERAEMPLYLPQIIKRFLQPIDLHGKGGKYADDNAIIRGFSASA